MNLYCVYPFNKEWCCYVFAESRNNAKMSVVRHFGNDDLYIDYGCKTIVKDTGGKSEVCDTECARLQELGVWYNFYENCD